ncbi:MAG: hypothetical protein Q8M92_03600 [Candidatus Subteraquimicrobiales bacterium]|nr:hypothetical protein [Candidatus Subteraquimicrobiales bacterium]
MGRFLGGKNYASSLAGMARDANRSNATKDIARSYKGLLKDNKITKDTYKSLSSAAKKQYGRPGNWAQRTIANVADDVSHPIRNTKRFMLDLGYKHDAISGKMVARSPLGVAGKVGVTAAFPAWYISDTVKDKNLSTKNKIGRSASYLALPMATRRLIPSLAGYTAVDKIFKSKTPVSTPSQLIQ